MECYSMEACNDIDDAFFPPFLLATGWVSELRKAILVVLPLS